MAYSADLFRIHLRLIPPSVMYRVISVAHIKTPLAFIDSDARFNDPRAERAATERFKVLYASNRLFTSLWEAAIRNAPAQTDEQYIARRVLDAVRVVALRWTAPLTVLDIRGSGYLDINASPDIVKTRHKDYSDSQEFSAFVVEHLPECEGILYSSRYTGHPCLALYDHAEEKLVRPASVLDPYGFADVRSAITDQGLPLSVVIERDPSAAARLLATLKPKQDK